MVVMTDLTLLYDIPITPHISSQELCCLVDMLNVTWLFVTSVNHLIYACLV